MRLKSLRVVFQAISRSEAVLKVIYVWQFCHKGHFVGAPYGREGEKPITMTAGRICILCLYDDFLYTGLAHMHLVSEHPYRATCTQEVRRHVHVTDLQALPCR